MNETSKKFVTFALMAAVLGCCAKSPPKWARKVHWESGTEAYFVGASTMARTEEQARREAYDNALTEAIQTLFGITGRVELASFADLKRVEIAEDVFVSTDEVDLRPRPVDIFVARVKEKGETRFNAYRSIAIDRSAADKELARLRKEATAKRHVKAESKEARVDTVSVSVEGRGIVIDGNIPRAKSEAIRMGIRRSCEKFVADWFSRSSRMERYETFDNLIYARCPSFVADYQVLGGHREGRLYKVNMDVQLKGAEISKRLGEAGLEREKTPDPNQKNITTETRNLGDTE